MRLLATLIGLPLMLAAPGAAAEPEALPRDIRLEHSLALPDSGDPRLEFTLRLPYERLVFERGETGFVARLRIACRAERRSDREEAALLLNDEVRVADFAASRERGQRFEREFALALGPGDWQVETLIYRRGEQRPWRDRFPLTVPDLAPGALFLQGPRWREGRGSGQVTPPFFFADPWRIAEDASSFADGDAAALAVGCEVLNWGERPLTGELLLSLESRRGDLVHYARRPLALAPGRQFCEWELPLAQLGMGVYKLELELVAGEQRRQLRGRLDVGLAQAAFGREWERTLALLQPLASGDERAALAAAPPSMRRQAWREFWERRAAAETPADNPALTAFCERISEANLRFGAGQRDGYLSDRGQVLLERGAPDRVEQLEDERNFRQLEYWYYLAAGLVYVFEDRHGAGDFLLLRVMNA
ncbi:GWxTD domain-containing protein [bacterium]|nr:GWxTD domain-containing protein [bacterium]